MRLHGMAYRAGDTTEPIIDLATLRVENPVPLRLNFDFRHPLGEATVTFDSEGNLWAEAEILDSVAEVYGLASKKEFLYFAVGARTTGTLAARESPVIGAKLIEVSVVEANIDADLSPIEISCDPTP